MDVEVVGKFLSTLPEDDDHPYRTGPWRPQTTEWDADDLDVVEGEIPARPRRRVPAQHREPAAPGDEDLPPVRRRRHGARRRLPRREGVLPQPVRPHRRASSPSNEAGEPLWPGLAEPVQLARRDDGWGARTRMKDASSTDVIVHRGIALTSFYQCGDLYRVDPFTAETLGKETWNGELPRRLGRLGAPQGRRPTPASCCSSTTQAGAVHALRRRRREQRPGPLHRRAAARPAAAARHGLHRELRRSSTISRCSGIRTCSRRTCTCRGSTPTCRPASPWCRAAAAAATSAGSRPTRPTCCTSPTPTRTATRSCSTASSKERRSQRTPVGSKWDKLFRFLALDRLQARLHRWRFNLVTGDVKEERLSESITEFGMINPGYAAADYRYTYAATGKPGWFLFDGMVKHDLRTGGEQHYRFADGVYGSEAAMAPRPNASRRGRRLPGHVDHRHERRRLLVPDLDAARFNDGPVCKLALPERVSSGTHATWAPGAQLRRWHDVDSRGAIGL